MTRVELGVLFTKLTERCRQKSDKDYFNGMALVYNDVALILCTDSMPYDLILDRCRKRELFLEATISGIISFHFRNVREAVIASGVQVGLKWYLGKRHATRAAVRILEVELERSLDAREYKRSIVVHKT